MDMEKAKEIRDILNKIDYYKNRLSELKKCIKLDVTICDGFNGRPTTYHKDDIEVKSIIKGYEKEIEFLNSKIRYIRLVESE